MCLSLKKKSQSLQVWHLAKMCFLEFYSFAKKKKKIQQA